MTAPRTLDAVIRVSKVNGRSGDSYMTEAEQTDKIVAWCAGNNATVDRWHYERDESGGTVDRDGLQAAAGRAIAGEVDGIIVARTNRFARTILGGLTVVGSLREAGKHFVAVTDGIDTASDDQFVNMKLALFLMIAEWQLDTIRAQWSDVRTRHVARGVSLGEPFGYRKDKDQGGKLVPVEAEADAVRAVFEGRAAGMSWSALADQLNATPGIKPRRAERFTYARAKQMVERRVYLGEIAVGDTVNRQAHEPIVTAKQWAAANERRGTAARREREPFLLAGLIRCASCGVRMAGMSDVRQLAEGPATYRYYRCRRSHSFGRCPAPARVRADEIEPMVEASFRDLYLTDRRLADQPVTTAEMSEATAAVEAAEAQLDAYLALDIDDVTRFQRGLDDRQNRLRAAQDRLSRAEQAERGFALPRSLSDEWSDLPIDTRRGYLSDGIAAVAVAPGTGPIPDRTAIWAVNDTTAPALLPGLPDPDDDGRIVARLTPLATPAGTWEAAS